MAFCSKKPRIETELDSPNVDDIFCITKERKRKIAQVIAQLCFVPGITLRPLKILNCNAADESAGISFSKACCSLEETHKMFLFGDIFRRGLDIARDFLKEGKVPSDKKEYAVLRKLLQFIDEGEWDSYKFIETLNETELTTLLANHLFGKLAESPDFLIDKNCAGKRKKDNCLCGLQDCKLTGSYGDTSIGNGEVWHGNVDIIVNNGLGIESLKVKPTSPGGKSNLSRNAQIIAETIVFSFLQKRRHPERKHFLTPCIGVGSRELIAMFYDSEHDVLLESKKVSLLDTSEESVTSGKISLEAIIVSWLVVNYKYFCSGLTDDMKSSLKADFFVQVEKKIEVYKNDLKFQNVGISYSSSDKDIDKDQISSSEYTFNMHKDIIEVIYNTLD